MRRLPRRRSAAPLCSHLPVRAVGPLPLLGGRFHLLLGYPNPRCRPSCADANALLLGMPSPKTRAALQLPVQFG